jgi:hypothetical protein
VPLHAARRVSDAQDTDLQINGQLALFPHVERTTLTRMGWCSEIHRTPGLHTRRGAVTGRLA